MEYKSILWKDTEVGQVVYLAGTYKKGFKAYGPHRVLDPIRRCLMSINTNRKFLHFPEDLLVEDK
jgi:hypothetical protein